MINPVVWGGGVRTGTLDYHMEITEIQWRRRQSVRNNSQSPTRGVHASLGTPLPYRAPVDAPCAVSYSYAQRYWIRPSDPCTRTYRITRIFDCYRVVCDSPSFRTIVAHSRIIGINYYHGRRPNVRFYARAVHVWRDNNITSTYAAARCD